MRNTAKNNTGIYRELWACYPDDNYTTFKELNERKCLSKEELLDKYSKKKDEIIGHIVEFPLKFLEKEQFSISRLDLIPERCYT